MATMTSVLQKLVMDFVLGGGGSPWTAPATLYVGLATNSTAPSTDGSTLTEVAAGGYVRQSITNNATNWPAGTEDASGYHKSNGIQINFPTSSTTVTFSAAAGTATYWFIATDNLAVGTSNIWLFGAISPSQALSQGSTADIPVSGLTITID